MKAILISSGLKKINEMEEENKPISPTDFNKAIEIKRRRRQISNLILIIVNK